jgi:hypothetical protein
MTEYETETGIYLSMVDGKREEIVVGERPKPADWNDCWVLRRRVTEITEERMQEILEKDPNLPVTRRA